MSAQSAIFNPSQTTSAATGDGFSVPRLTTTGRLAIAFGTGDSGMMVYDTTLNNLFIWTGSAWESVPASGDAGINGAVQYNDNGVVSGAINFVYNKVNQKVGIGTITPNVELDVVGSATITGDLTVRTNKLFVNATGVGVGTTSLFGDLNIQNGSNCRFEVTSQAGGTTIENLNNARNAYLNMTMFADAYIWNRLGSEAMRLNANGLGVGYSPSGSADKLGSAATLGVVATGTTADLNFRNSSLTAIQRIRYTDGTGVLTIGSATGTAYPVELGGSTSSRAVTIDGSGNVGIGVTPSGYRLHVRADFTSTVGGAFIESGEFNQKGLVVNCTSAALSANIVEFQREGTARLTLDASGNLLVAKTASGFNVAGAEIRSNGEVLQTIAASTDATIVSKVYSSTAAAYRFYVGLGGTVFATNTTISAISDARLKENVQDIDVGLGAILALKPRKFDWKEGKGKNIKGDRGFIAQEFEQVFPQLVDKWADESPEGETPYKSIRQDLIPVLVKAIQELAARVQTLETR